MGNDKVERKWKSGSDVLSKFRACNAATTLTRLDLAGKPIFESKPLEEIEYAFQSEVETVHLRRKQREKWIPPSEDPFYRAKWMFYKSLLAKE